MRKKYIKSAISVLLCLSFLLSGCGKEEKIPKLIPPAISNESYRPVEYGSVSQLEIEMADVMPKEYCAFFTSAAKVDEICVDIGQHVEKGTILAKMDIEELSKTLQDYQASLSEENANFEDRKRILFLQTQETNLKRQAALNLGDTDTVTECDKQLSLLQENDRYETMMHNHNVAMYGKRIKDIQKELDGGQLIATHDGYVTYVKNVAESENAEAYETIVTVSDYEELHLELSKDISDALYQERMAKKYDYIYTIIGDGKKELTPVSYTNEELIAMESVKLYPRISFELDGMKGKVRMGDKVPVYFTTKETEHVLRVGTDSIYTEGNETFVYVKNGESREKRTIETGSQGEFYAEVLNGLSEGELVYASSNSMTPENYEEYEVSATTYSPSSNELGMKCFFSYTKTYAYNCNQNAEVRSISCMKDDEVKAGDTLMKLKIKEGSARIVEMENGMKSLSKQKQDVIASYDGQIKEMDERIRMKQEADKQNEVEVSEENPEEPQEERDYDTVETLQCEREILVREKQIALRSLDTAYAGMQRELAQIKKNNNGNGELTICALQDGVVGKVNVYEEQSFEDTQMQLLLLYDSSSKKLTFRSDADYIGVGNVVKVTLNDKTTYELETVGNDGQTDKYCLAYMGEKPYMTHSTNSTMRTFLSVKELPENVDLTNATVDYSCARMQNAVVIPSTYLNVEKKNYNPNQINYFVWKKVGDTLVKQYVQIQENLNTASEICILDGLKPGDKVISEIVEK